jgi:hypothetical protein
MVTQTLMASEMTDASSSGSERGGPIRMPFTSVLSPKAMRRWMPSFVAAIAAGGREKTAPASQLQYHPDYCATRVLDPDDHDVEASIAGKLECYRSTNFEPEIDEGSVTPKGIARNCQEPPPERTGGGFLRTRPDRAEPLTLSAGPRARRLAPYCIVRSSRDRDRRYPDCRGQRVPHRHLWSCRSRPLPRKPNFRHR